MGGSKALTQAKAQTTPTPAQDPKQKRVRGGFYGMGAPIGAESLNASNSRRGTFLGAG